VEEIGNNVNLYAEEFYNAEWKTFEFSGGLSKEKTEAGQHRYELVETEESKMRCHNQYI
jgi:hypothetical protein